MKKALQDVENGSPIATAARENGVPRKTLSDRVHKKVAVDAKLGAECKLSKDSEEMLNQYIQYMAHRAFPLTVNQILMFAWTIDKASGSNKFGENGPSYHWWRGFKARHPDLRLRRPDPLDRSRAVNSTVNNLREYFSLLKEVLTKYHLDDKPDRIFNCDESIIDLNKSAQRVVIPRRQKHAHSRQVGITQHISIHCCVSASGSVMPPYIIFSKGFPGGSYAKDGPDGALYGKSDSGFMDEELFLNWFEKIFLTKCPQNRSEDDPVLLLMDGHVSHCSAPLIQKAKEENVILFALVPHTTHICQPLDVAVYKSLKVHISKMIKIGQALRGDLWIAKKDVPRIIKTPFEHVSS
ncbi:Jerky protein-like-like [Holothuria leucospilota]|uniref:Jerky protein-like-like n=1 Tax=Holothuria leucospilota TaxID=206669 RepID=A0A9Q1HDT9_HOLLE|nr:Jerky protein-like-like [Holothuria leucospilota]